MQLSESLINCASIFCIATNGKEERALYGKFMHPGMKLYCEKTLFFHIFCDVSLYSDQFSHLFGWILNLYDSTHRMRPSLVNLGMGNPPCF